MTCHSRLSSFFFSVEYVRIGYKTQYDCTGIIIQAHQQNDTELFSVMYTSSMNIEKRPKGSISRRKYAKNELDFINNDELDRIISHDIKGNEEKSSSSSSSSSNLRNINDDSASENKSNSNSDTLASIEPVASQSAAHIVPSIFFSDYKNTSTKYAGISTTYGIFQIVNFLQPHIIQEEIAFMRNRGMKKSLLLFTLLQVIESTPCLKHENDILGLVKHRNKRQE